MRGIVAITILATLALLSLGCSTEGERVDPSVEGVPSQEYNSKDLRQNVEQGVQKLLQLVRRDVPNAFAGSPQVFVAPVVNRTDEHIDPKMVQGYLETELKRQANIRLLERGDAMKIAQNELLFQQGNLVNPKEAKRLGQVMGAKYFVFGELSNLRTFTRSGMAEGQFFYFNLALINVETLEKWPVDVQIQKVARRGWLSW